MQELVEAIKAGDRAQLAELYKSNTGLLYSLARRYRGLDPMVSTEDLMQAGFLGLVDAVEAWEPERGGWYTIAIWCAKNAMREALGIRGSRQRAHLGAVSLDAPIGGEDNDITRADLLADESLPDADERVLDEQRRAAVRAAVARLEGRKRGVVEWHDLEGQTFAQIGESLGVSPERVKQLRENAFKDLRRDQRLRRALDNETLFYQHLGANGFNTSWTSITEKVALWRIEHRELYERSDLPPRNWTSSKVSHGMVD